MLIQFVTFFPWKWLGWLHFLWRQQNLFFKIALLLFLFVHILHLESKKVNNVRFMENDDHSLILKTEKPLDFPLWEKKFDPIFFSPVTGNMRFFWRLYVVLIPYRYRNEINYKIKLLLVPPYPVFWGMKPETNIFFIRSQRLVSLYSIVTTLRSTWIGCIRKVPQILKTFSWGRELIKSKKRRKKNRHLLMVGNNIFINMY